MNLKKSDITCPLCNETIHNDNCSPKGCNHVFHSSCFENWTVATGSSEEYACPAPHCTSTFFEIVVRKIPHGLATKVVSLKESHQCPICCEPLQTPVAMPESCNHTFCYVCLREWSRVRHECPLDRGSFDLILLSEKIGGPIIKRVREIYVFWLLHSLLRFHIGLRITDFCQISCASESEDIITFNVHPQI